MLRLLTSILTVATTVLFMAGCAQKALSVQELEDLSPEERTSSILQHPQVNDIYAANLSQFSEFSFGEGGEAYGLLRVINVTPEGAVVVTEEAAWAEPEGALDDLRSEFSESTWDRSEEIIILFADLISAQKEGLILEARRLNTEQIQAYLK